MNKKIIIALDEYEIKAIISLLNYVIVEIPMSQITKYSFDLLKRKLQAELDKHCSVKPQ